MNEILIKALANRIKAENSDMTIEQVLFHTKKKYKKLLNTLTTKEVTK